jgi:hypothetical protein
MNDSNGCARTEKVNESQEKSRVTAVASASRQISVLEVGKTVLRYCKRGTLARLSRASFFEQSLPS